MATKLPPSQEVGIRPAETPPFSQQTPATTSFVAAATDYATVPSPPLSRQEDTVTAPITTSPSSQKLLMRLLAPATPQLRTMLIATPAPQRLRVIGLVRTSSYGREGNQANMEDRLKETVDGLVDIFLDIHAQEHAGCNCVIDIEKISEPYPPTTT